MIEKSVKQVFHVYPFFDAEILMFGTLPTMQLKMASREGTSNSRASSKSTSKARPVK